MPGHFQKTLISIILIVELLTLSVSMYIGWGLSVEAHRATQAERQAANTATAAASGAAAVAATSTAAAAAAGTERGGDSASPHHPKNESKASTSIYVVSKNKDTFFTTTDYRTIEISNAWKRFMTFLVVNLFQASEIYFYCSYITSCL